MWIGNLESNETLDLGLNWNPREQYINLKVSVLFCAVTEAVRESGIVAEQHN